MNKKAEKFDVLAADIEQTGNKWFTKEVIEGDEYGTVVYHGRLEIHGNSLPVFIVLDNSVFSYIRVAITTTSITAAAIKNVLPKLNELNQQYKVTKYYVNDEDSNIYADISVPSTDDTFEPAVLVNLMLEVIKPHLDEVHPEILKIVGQVK